MKGKVALFFLMVFAAVQIYFARQPMAHQVVGSSWIQVSRHAGGVVERQQGYYLVANQRVYRLQANAVHITARPTNVVWEDIPQPTGQGIWRVAYTRQGVPVVGYGGQVFPSLDGTEVIWQDPISGALYRSQGMGSGLSPFASGLEDIGRVLWAPDGAAVAVEARGIEGFGVYVFDGDQSRTALIASAPLLGFGFSREETVLAALGQGRIVSQGHRSVQIPAMSPEYVDNGVASIWGIHQSESILWDQGKMRDRKRPDVNFVGSAQFSQNGMEVAILAKTSDQHAELYLDGTKHQWSLRLPYDVAVNQYHLEGFVGNRWVLVGIDSGPDQGTYAWWVHSL